MEPLAANPAKPRGERELLVLPDARIDPGRSIAKTLAAILAPSPIARADIRSAQFPPPPFRRPSQFAAVCFVPQEILERPAACVAHTQPDEMKQLMDEDAGKFG